MNLQASLASRSSLGWVHLRNPRSEHVGVSPVRIDRYLFAIKALALPYNERSIVPNRLKTSHIHGLIRRADTGILMEAVSKIGSGWGTSGCWTLTRPLVLTLGLAIPASAQTTSTGALTGLVLDPS